MHFPRIFLHIFLIISCSIALGLSLKCFTCTSPQECKKPQLLECSKLLANNTRTYLDAYHQGVNLNATSLYYECFYEELRVVFLHL
ncbi:uncharacterized protein LOC119633735 isoform X2 [Glossina fuscipes]|uniref:Uncharacterized protein LOC119633735 isoform X2 n=1 Tax=Glossina fuscipes TaxID=7396 RepID=A0A8U0WEU1_9MUSC|nr:uncharacterized protein LOC119633735 isoform X2 [Glossina fuscipes]